MTQYALLHYSPMTSRLENRLDAWRRQQMQAAHDQVHRYEQYIACPPDAAARTRLTEEPGYVQTLLLRFFDTIETA